MDQPVGTSSDLSGLELEPPTQWSPPARPREMKLHPNVPLQRNEGTEQIFSPDFENKPSEAKVR
jgi:hypothetical protein